MSQEKKSAIESLEWITRLPECGGPWGDGIIATVSNIETEIETKNMDKAELKKRIAVLSSDIQTRKRLIDSTVKRAKREAVALYGEEMVESVMAIAAEASASAAE